MAAGGSGASSAVLCAVAPHVKRSLVAGVQRRELRAGEELLAAAAAAAVDEPERCLIVASLQQKACESLLSHSNSSAAAAAALPAAERRACTERATAAWRAAAVVLERRAAEGTLLACTPAEDAFAAHLEAEVLRSGLSLPLVAGLLPGADALTDEDVSQHTAALAPPGSLGLKTYLDVAVIVARRLFPAPDTPGALQPFSIAEDAPRWLAFLLRAPALMAAARAPGGPLRSSRLLERERTFARYFSRAIVPTAMQQQSPHARTLAAAWVGSGAAEAVAAGESLEPQQSNEMMQALRTFMDVGTAADVRVRDADVARHGLRDCALPSCGAREPEPKRFKACSACWGAVYCCAEHQKAHWKAGHKAACRAACAKRADEGATPRDW